MDAYGDAIPFRSRGAIEAARRGAVASLIRSLASASIGSPHTGSMTYAPDVPPIPHAALSTEAADLLHRLVAAGERPRIRLTLTCRSEAPVESANVVAHLRGREKPGELVVIGAHLDSWDLGSGATDAATSVAIAMETPRLLKELGLVPRRTIRVVLFMNEEMGGTGAQRYAQMPPDELAAHAAALESDAGAGAPLGFRVSRGPSIEGTQAGPPGAPDTIAPALAAVRRWARKLEPVGATWVDYGGIRGSASDLAPLGLAGVLCLALRNDQTHYLDIHHTDGDTLDKVDPQLLRRNLAAMAAMTYALAESPERF
jgi:acetylornithine deacetylase/succinyl-diaminopimelate desuccinylase-like protein